MLVMVLLMKPVTAPATEQALLLEVEVNGYSIAKIGEFVMRDGVLLARAGEWQALGFRVPAGAPADGLIAAADLPGVVWRLDQPSQILHVTAPDESLLPVQLKVGRRADSGGPIETGTGVTFDYDVTGSDEGRQRSVGGLFDLRGYSAWGVASSSLLVSDGIGSGGFGGPAKDLLARLDTVYTYSDPASLMRYRLGDFINGGLAWTRPVRLGGIQAFSDFSMRPDLITFPLPSLSGSVAVPSTVEVMANDTRLFSREIAPGPFEIPQLPVVTGANDIAMTLTDALGRQVVTTVPFYASATLLAPGLQTFSAQAGAIRRNWGLISDDYAGPAASGTFRRGLSSSVTVEASAEGADGTGLLGAGIVLNVFDLAVFNASAAESAGPGSGGRQFSIGLRRIDPAFSIGASATVAGRDYRDIAAVNGDPVPRLQLNASAGLSLGRFGTVGVAYAGLDSDEPASQAAYGRAGNALNPLQNGTSLSGVIYLPAAQHEHILSSSYSVQLGPMSFYATMFHDFSAGGGNGVLAGLTLPLGQRSSVGIDATSGSSGRSAEVMLQQSTVVIGDWGYQAYLSDGNPDHEFGQLQYKAPFALLTGGADRLDHETTIRLEAQGALSYADGGLFASDTIQDSFAIVDTNGLANVRVLDENRDAGTTDDEGKLLVPDLRSFDVNHLAIEPDDIPVDASIGVTNRDVRPMDRSGVVVRFAVRVSHGALIRLVDAAGSPVPVGSTATLRATGITVPVGYDGDAYVEDLAAHNDLDVERQTGERCMVAFDYTPVTGEIPRIGPLVCVGGAP